VFLVLVLIVTLTLHSMGQSGGWGSAAVQAHRNDDKVHEEALPSAEYK
jgi:hypothetical protein